MARKRISHGKSKTRLYQIYKGMKTRCYNKNRNSYKDYGKRGVVICEEWLNEIDGFLNFEKWSLNNGYKESLSIDRINVNGNYEPSNCRWSNSKEQNNNTRLTRKYEIEGIVLSLPEICEKYNLKYNNINMRFHRGKSLLESLKEIKGIEKMNIKQIKEVK